MIGSLTVAPEGFNHVLVAVDKFTKWIKYKPIVKISSNRVVDFISDIIHRFGFPHTIITDLGSNFTSQSFLGFLRQFLHRGQICISGSPSSKWSSGMYQWLSTRWLEKETLRRQLQEGWQVDPRTTPRGLGAANAA